MNKIKELVDSVADNLLEYHRDHCPESSSEQQCGDLLSSCSICWAKEILSHPDLALIDREKLLPEGWEGIPLSGEIQSHLQYITPLAEAVKEANKE